MKDYFKLEQKIDKLQKLYNYINKTSSIKGKLALLNSLPAVNQEYASNPIIQKFSLTFKTEQEYIIKLIIAIGEGPIVFNVHTPQEKYSRMHSMLDHLIELEISYSFMGGIIGYLLIVLRLMQEQETPQANYNHYIHPEGIHLNEGQSEVRQAIRWGIEAMCCIGEIYPVGGAGDRLDLHDELTGHPLPAAVLPFLGRSLVENLVRDLQAREYLFFKLYGKQICSPISMMTSSEKNNHQHIIEICNKHRWFGRPAESFRFFEQPVVPVITEEGSFSLTDFLTLNLKPGGHGVIWKIAEEKNIFKWMQSVGRFDSIVRQINNPIAGLDFALLSLAGIGYKEKKSIGFLSCERLLKSAEGTNVLIEKKLDHSTGYEYCLTNIEYTDFAKKGIKDEPATEGSPHSTYPTNTNILYVNIPAIQKAIKKCSIPGKLINFKSKVPFINAEGHMMQVRGGRLESTMQNIADYMVDCFPHQLEKDETASKLQSFIIYNKRIKTISTTKVSYKSGENVVGTPEGAHYDLLTNHWNLFQNRCKFSLPPQETIQEYLQSGPNVLISYLPALGPLYSVIEQKIRKGSLGMHSELLLEISEVDIENLYVEGSLHIIGTSPLGEVNEGGILTYGNECRCTLKNVTVNNLGIDTTAHNVYWKNHIKRYESAQIYLGESSEFHAENVILEGDYRIEVPARHRMVISQKNGEVDIVITPIKKAKWKWQYSFDQDNHVKLTNVEG